MMSAIATSIGLPLGSLFTKAATNSFFWEGDKVIKIDATTAWRIAQHLSGSNPGHPTASSSAQNSH